MDMLNSSTLLDAFRRCDEYANIEICIVTKSLWNAHELIDGLYDEIRANRLDGWVIGRFMIGGGGMLKSVRNSHIRIISIQDTEQIRSHRFHWILFENGIAEDAFNALSSVECLSPPWERISDSTELDDFLRSFRILPNTDLVR